jgi:hypothetical protein
MKPATRKHPFQSAPRVSQYTGAIEWEELPSLADSLQQRLVVRGRHGDFGDSSSFGSSAWDNTMPASLEVVFEPEPFHEPIRGLSTREVREPDVFRHFFA